MSEVGKIYRNKKGDAVEIISQIAKNFSARGNILMPEPSDNIYSLAHA